MDKQLEKEATDYAYGEYEGSHAAVSRSSYIAGATSSSTVKGLMEENKKLKEDLKAVTILYENQKAEYENRLRTQPDL